MMMTKQPTSMRRRSSQLQQLHNLRQLQWLSTVAQAQQTGQVSPCDLFLHGMQQPRRRTGVC